MSTDLNEIAWRNIKGQLFTLRQVQSFPDAYFNNIMNLVARGGNRAFLAEYPNAINLLNAEAARRAK